MKKHENCEYTYYKSIPSSERMSGNFSEKTVNEYHAILQRSFIRNEKRRIIISAVNHAVSLSVIIGLTCLLSLNTGNTLNEAVKLNKFIAMLWFTSFLTMFLLKVWDYPTMKSAKNDLELLNCLVKNRTIRI